MVQVQIDNSNEVFPATKLQPQPSESFQLVEDEPSERLNNVKNLL